MTAMNDEATYSGTVDKKHSRVSPFDYDVFVGLNHLVLDLDHTLISSFEFGETPTPRKPSENVVSPILTEEYHDEFGLPQMYHATISNVVVLIKLRPYVRSFIKSAAALGLKLHVYTKGRRAYMNEVIRLVDPDGLITGRRISRDDEPEASRESQKDIVLIDPVIGPSKSRLYIVLDDSPAVWANCSEQIEMVTARRYTFSDKFVLFLRSMEKAACQRPDKYPVDSDNFLEHLAGSVIKCMVEQRSRSFVPSPYVDCQENNVLLVEDEISPNEDETFTPINVWTTKNLTQTERSNCAVIKVTRGRFV
jgi:hypothetical protein